MHESTMLGSVVSFRIPPAQQSAEERRRKALEKFQRNLRREIERPARSRDLLRTQHLLAAVTGDDVKAARSAAHDRIRAISGHKNLGKPFRQPMIRDLEVILFFGIGGRALYEDRIAALALLRIAKGELCEKILEIFPGLNDVLEA